MIFRRDPLREAAARLYAEAVAQARRPDFYESAGVPDSLDGRFEMVALHVFLIMRRLRGEGVQAEALSRRVAEDLFADMDANLREMGVGDLGVGPRVRRMAKAFYGRAAAYDAGLEESAGPATLADALRRNLYGTVAAAPGQAERMAAYVRAAAAALAAQPVEAVLAGRVRFEAGPAPPGAGPASR
ncbi:MAG: hypothetical protein IRY94_11480 [Rhodospirillaceae bacterium]|nr:hypothetical protein [Rhodospirillaceae bacterium]